MTVEKKILRASLVAGEDGVFISVAVMVSYPHLNYSQGWSYYENP